MKKPLLNLLLILFFLVLNIQTYSQTLEWARYFGSGGPPPTDLMGHVNLSADTSGNTYLIGFIDNLQPGNAGLYFISYNTIGGTRYYHRENLGLGAIAYSVIDGQHYSFVSTYGNAGNSFLEKYSPDNGLVFKTNYTPTGRMMSDSQITYLNTGSIIYKYDNTGYKLDSLTTPAYLSYFGKIMNDFILADNGTDSILVMRVTQSGNTVWRIATKPAGDTALNIIDLKIVPSGNIYVLVNAGFPSRGMDYCVIKLNSSGVQQWVSSYNNPGNDIPGSWKIDNSENIYICGNSKTVKFNSSGTFQWAEPHPQTVINLDKNNDIIVAILSGTNITTSKISSATGSLLWSINYPIAAGSNLWVCGIASDNSQNIYVGGHVAVPNFGDQGILLKYSTVYNSISGVIRYQDNNQLVTSGYVKAIKYDWVTYQVITLDSASIQSNGTYSLGHVPKDSTYIMAFENDEALKLFVATYYPSATNWQNATVLYPTGNLTDINILVYRINNSGDQYHIGGNVFNDGQFNPLTYIGLPNSIVYAKVGNTYAGYSVSNGSAIYQVDSLAPASYSLTVDRIGYNPAYRSVVISNSSQENINFNLSLTLVSIIKSGKEIPSIFLLYQNYPNPFNPVTTIKFELPKSSLTKLIVYDILGKKVSELVNEQLQPGMYQVKWETSNYSSGIYFYKLESGDFIQTKKLVILK